MRPIFPLNSLDGEFYGGLFGGYLRRRFLSLPSIRRVLIATPAYGYVFSFDSCCDRWGLNPIGHAQKSYFGGRQTVSLAASVIVYDLFLGCHCG